MSEAASNDGRSQPLFERTRTKAIILGSFFLLFLPLVLLQTIPNFVEWLPYLFLLQVVGLGVTHFFITLAVYFQSKNLAYFNSSGLNRVIYFVVPATILLLFALSAATEFRARAPTVAMYLFGALRFFDFFHVGRQSFGMLQIFKRPFGDALPPWLRTAENAFFIGMAMLQWESFAAGGSFASEVLYARLPAAAMGSLAVVIALGYLHAAMNAAQRPWVPLTYFLMQAVCASAAVYQTHLYLIALALHYVEYHVIMAPRCLAAPLNPEHGLDRAYAKVSSRPLLFYSALVAVVVLFEARNHVPGGLSGPTTFFVHIFDGIFFLHYFIEAFLWKFKNPFYRESLAPLYFGTRPPGVSRRSAGGRPWLPLGVAATLAITYAGGWLDAPGRAFKHNLIDRVHADNHVRWGLGYAAEGELVDARKHFLEATERTPDDERARAFLRMTEARMPGGGSGAAR